MIVGRIIAYLGSEYSPVSHAWITKIFVGVDVFTILVQAGGGAILVGRDVCPPVSASPNSTLAGWCPRKR